PTARCSPQPRTGTVAALGPSAQLMDRFGAVRPLQVGDDGQMQVALAPATANTVPGFPRRLLLRRRARPGARAAPERLPAFRAHLRQSSVARSALTRTARQFFRRQGTN